MNFFKGALKRDLTFNSQLELNNDTKKSSTKSKSLSQTQTSQKDCNIESSTAQCDLFQLFVRNLPEWGGRIDLDSSHSLFLQYKNYTIANTCTIDYFFLFLWISSKLNPNLLVILNNNNLNLTKKLVKIIEFIDSKNWNRVKSIWAIDVCNFKPTRRVFNFFGCEFDIFLKFLCPLQEYEIFCENNQCELNNIIIDKKNQFYFKIDLNNNVLMSFQQNCSACGSNLKNKLIQTSPWLFVQNACENANQFICFDELPKFININGFKYILLCATIISTNAKDHFCAIFNIENKTFLFDDLNSRFTETIPNINKVSVSCYYFSN